jgi:hypothetical protein
MIRIQIRNTAIYAVPFCYFSYIVYINTHTHIYASPEPSFRIWSKFTTWFHNRAKTITPDAVVLPAERSRGHSRQVVRGIQTRNRKIHNLVGFDPALVDALKSLKVDDENRWQAPDLQLLHGQLVGLTGGAVVLLLLA